MDPFDAINALSHQDPITLAEAIVRLRARVTELEAECNAFRDEKNRYRAALQDTERAIGAFSSMVFEGPEFYDALTVLKAAQRDAMKVYTIVREALK